MKRLFVKLCKEGKFCVRVGPSRNMRALKMAKMEYFDFGPVRITKGKHKGIIGYYDDTDGKRALVFLGVPFISEFVWLPFGSIEELANVSSIEIESFRRANPELCKIMGV